MNGNTVQQGTASTDATQPRGWKEFCELHAIATAKELAKQYRIFAKECPLHDVPAAENFSVQFTDLFQEYFRHEVGEGGPAMAARCRVVPLSGAGDYREAQRRLSEGTQGPVGSGTPTVHKELQDRRERRCPSLDTNRAPCLLRKSRSSEEFSDPAFSLPERSPSSASSTSSTTHFSFKNIRQSMKDMFKKKSAECPAAVGQREAKEAGASETPQQIETARVSRQSLLNLLSARLCTQASPRLDDGLKVCREGHLSYLMVDDATLDTQSHWHRCRLLLRKSCLAESEDYQLELFDPPKSSKPKLTARCCDITEIRRCNRLEMPDNINTFVLKVKSLPGSVILETDSDQQLYSWTADLKDCMNKGSDEPGGDNQSASQADVIPAVGEGSSDSINQGAVHLPFVAQLYHKTDQFLSSYPWFHGQISRVKAAQLVQSPGQDGHGVFLVRQSETRRGEYVLTFNFQGKAKHLRLSLTDRGHCRVQHLRFSSVVDMLNHFQLSPIPLECGTPCDVKLSNYVLANAHSQGGSASGDTVLIPFSVHRWNSEPSLAHYSATSCPRALTLDSLHQPEQIFHVVSPQELSGALRRSDSLGLQARHRPQRDSDYELDQSSRGRKRATDNQYMFL
ncbi:SH2B adapter protein 3 [Polypterus senegalus]|uniref:SH2B adapter protein 3 n=1 Tax=Polypterus senegalus TaxID=55291 RepID=UPI001965987D|nr:SH2B adapter protein 3 [Polypterus senegalus]XP_039628117.1 SH2B adapter protein 3 [Polypterus senegalus]